VRFVGLIIIAALLVVTVRRIQRRL